MQYTNCNIILDKEAKNVAALLITNILKYV